MASDGDERKTEPAGTITDSQDPSPVTQKAYGHRVAFGRYILLERLGSGGMGDVYSAYDPELDRKVALKVLRQEAALQQWRLRREAQALARLQHPNVVAVFDVGVVHDQGFVAMELVDGTTLAAWLNEQPRPLREIVEVFVQAGRGLAAAHAVGLVHRDFKPANVLIGRDGRVRVVDFGLARSAGTNDETDGAPQVPNPAEATSPSPKPFVTITRSGALMGTPRYMSPEQLFGQPADAKSDQFSFCVALYRALWGEPPFAGEDITTIANEVANGRLRLPPSDSRVPAWVRTIILRGLATTSADRWPSMEALLAALARDPATLRRRWMLAAGVVVVTAAVMLGAVALQRRASLVCGGAERKLAGLWNDARRDRVHAAFAATGKPYADVAFAGVTRALDTFSNAWVSMHTEACEATHVRREQSEELLDLRMECLGQRLQEAQAEVDLFTRADAEVVEKAVQMTSSLSGLSTCSDVAALRAPVRPPADPSLRARVAGVRTQLAQGKALNDAAKYKEALALAGTAVTAARALKYRPLEAEALLLLGEAQWYTAGLASSAKSLEDAVLAARAGRDAVSEVNALALLVTVADEQEHYQQAEFWGRHGLAAVEALGGADERPLANLLESLSYSLREQAKYDEALDDARRALAIRERIFGPESKEVAPILRDLAAIVELQGHPDEAEPLVRHALAIFEKQLGPQHPELTKPLETLSFVLHEQGRFAEELDYDLRSLAIREKAFGNESPKLVQPLNNIGTALLGKNKYHEALPYFRRALALAETSGPTHYMIPIALNNIGEVQRESGQYEEALAAYQRALAIWTQVQEPDHPYLAWALTGIGRTELDWGFPAKAQAPLERALAIREKQQADPSEIAETRFALGSALWQMGRDRARAHALVVQARAEYAGKGVKNKQELGTVDAWLAKHH
jgi:tetratricopeptide (TPR) repeat protein/predicted Ser/Thr protein kinase